MKTAEQQILEEMAEAWIISYCNYNGQNDVNPVGADLMHMEIALSVLSDKVIFLFDDEEPQEGDLVEALYIPYKPIMVLDADKIASLSVHKLLNSKNLKILQRNGKQVILIERGEADGEY